MYLMLVTSPSPLWTLRGRKPVAGEMLDTEHKKLINSTISTWAYLGLDVSQKLHENTLQWDSFKDISSGTLPDTHSPWELLLLHAPPVSFWTKALHGHSLTPPHDPLWGLQQSHEPMSPPLKRKLELGLSVMHLCWLGNYKFSHWAHNGFGRCYPPWREHPPLQFLQKIYRKGKERTLSLLDD